MKRPGEKAGIRGFFEDGNVPWESRYQGNDAEAATYQDRASAALEFAAKALDLGDPDTNNALGETVTGQAKIDWKSGESMQLTGLEIDTAYRVVEGSAPERMDLPRVDWGLDGE